MSGLKARAGRQPSASDVEDQHVKQCNEHALKLVAKKTSPRQTGSRTAKALIVLVAPFLFTSPAHAQLEWRISIKVFTNASGGLPRLPFWNLGGTTLFQELSNGVAFAHNILVSTRRGYQWRLLDITTVSGATIPLPSSTNSWFNLPVNSANQVNLDSSVKSNPTGFGFRANAIDFYYVNETNGNLGGVCAF